MNSGVIAPIEPEKEQQTVDVVVIRVQFVDALDGRPTAGIVQLGSAGGKLWESAPPGRHGRTLYHRVEFLLPVDGPGEYELRGGPHPIQLVVQESAVRPQNPQSLGPHTLAAGPISIAVP